MLKYSDLVKNHPHLKIHHKLDKNYRVFIDGTEGIHIQMICFQNDILWSRTGDDWLKPLKNGYLLISIEDKLLTFTPKDKCKTLYENFIDISYQDFINKFKYPYSYDEITKSKNEFA